MTTLNTVISLEDCEEPSIAPRKVNIALDDNEILSSVRMKQRRATIAPTEIPVVQLPRYLRDPTRSSSRRQSLPVTSLNNKLGTANYSQKNPLKLKQKLNEIDSTSDEPTGARFGADAIGQQLKSFPLDNRLRNCDLESNQNGVGSAHEINNSSESKRFFSFLSNSKSNIPQIGELKSDKQKPGSTASPPSSKKTNLTVANQPRRHSIAVSVLTDSRRTRNESPLPGMTGFGEFENSLYPTRDRIVTVESRDRRPSVNPKRKVGPYIPKPDNHLLLSIFSFLCCCPLLGLVALIFSIQVDRKYENGKKEESIIKSKNARLWALMAVMIGMLTILGGSLYALIVLAILS